jgi:hypothetical protein
MLRIGSSDLSTEMGIPGLQARAQAPGLRGDRAGRADVKRLRNVRLS